MNLVGMPLITLSALWLVPLLGRPDPVASLSLLRTRLHIGPLYFNTICSYRARPHTKGHATPNRSTPSPRRHVLGLGLAGLGALALAGCTTGGGGLPLIHLACIQCGRPLTMRRSVARLINAYRTAQVPPR